MLWLLLLRESGWLWWGDQQRDDAIASRCSETGQHSDSNDKGIITIFLLCILDLYRYTVLENLGFVRTILTSQKNWYGPKAQCWWIRYIRASRATRFGLTAIAVRWRLKPVYVQGGRRAAMQEAFTKFWSRGHKPTLSSYVLIRLIRRNMTTLERLLSIWTNLPKSHGLNRRIWGRDNNPKGITAHNNLA